MAVATWSLPSSRYRTAIVEPTTILPSLCVIELNLKVMSPRFREREMTSVVASIDLTTPRVAWIVGAGPAPSANLSGTCADWVDVTAWAGPTTPSRSIAANILGIADDWSSPVQRVTRDEP
jgi:hypothetical protein